MKNSFEFLSELVNKKMICVEMFYSIRISTDKIYLQGKLTSETKNKLEKNFGINFQLNPNCNWIEFKNENLDIALTF